MQKLKNKALLAVRKRFDMLVSLWKRKKILLLTPVFILFLTFVSISAVYKSRPPLLIVTDQSFITLYGPKRMKKLESRISRMLFRRIMQVIVDESAAPTLVAFAVEEAYKSPWAVLLPYRHVEGARYYLEKFPDIPVWILAGKSKKTQDYENFKFIGTDIALDIYRSGLCAALIAAGRDVVFVSDGTLPDEYKDVFIEGLRAQGHLANPIWGNAYFTYSVTYDLGCVVLAGPAADFLEQSLSVPLIVFSWIDPAFTPYSVKVTFDDSPWIILPKVINSLLNQEDIFESSVPGVIKKHIDNGRDFKKLNNLVKEKM
jgi:hypothetical protein